MNYTWLNASITSGWSATEAGTTANNYKVNPLSEDVTIIRLTAWVTTAPGSGKSRAFTIRDDAADTAASVTISDTATSATWTGSVAIAAASLVSMETTPTGTPTAPGSIFWVIEYTTAGDYYLMLGGQDTTAAASTYYSVPDGNSTAAQATSDFNGYALFPMSAAVTKVAASAGVAPGSGKSRTFYATKGTMGVAGATDSSFSAAISGTNKVAVSSSGSLALAQFGWLVVKSVGASTPATSPISSCLTIAPTTPGDIAVCSTQLSLSTATASHYWHAHGQHANATNTTESAVYYRLPECTLKGLTAYLSAAPGSSTRSRIFTLRSNSADTTVSVTYTNAALGPSASASTAAHGDGNLFSFKHQAVNAPAAAGSTLVGWVMAIEQEEPIPEATGSGNFGWSSTATGKTPRKGTGSGTYGWTSTAVGKSTRTAAAANSNYSFTGEAIGKATPKAGSSGAYTWTTGSVGEAYYEGQASGNYGFTTGAVVGDTPTAAPRGQGQYWWDSFARGYSYRSATATGTYGWSTTAVGKRVAKGTASPSTYTFASTAVGKRHQKGVASGTYRFDQGESVGYRPGSAFGSGTYGWVATATGLFIPKPVPGVVGWIAE